MAVGGDDHQLLATNSTHEGSGERDNHQIGGVSSTNDDVDGDGDDDDVLVEVFREQVHSAMRREGAGVIGGGGELQLHSQQATALSPSHFSHRRSSAGFRLARHSIAGDYAADSPRLAIHRQTGSTRASVSYSSHHQHLFHPETATSSSNNYLPPRQYPSSSTQASLSLLHNPSSSFHLPSQHSVAGAEGIASPKNFLSASSSFLQHQRAASSAAASSAASFGRPDIGPNRSTSTIGAELFSLGSLSRLSKARAGVSPNESYIRSQGRSFQQLFAMRDIDFSDGEDSNGNDDGSGGTGRETLSPAYWEDNVVHDEAFREKFFCANHETAREVVQNFTFGALAIGIMCCCLALIGASSFCVTFVSLSRGSGEWAVVYGSFIVAFDLYCLVLLITCRTTVSKIRMRGHEAAAAASAAAVVEPVRALRRHVTTRTRSKPQPQTSRGRPEIRKPWYRRFLPCIDWTLLGPGSSGNCYIQILACCSSSVFVTVITWGLSSSAQELSRFAMVAVFRLISSIATLLILIERDRTKSFLERLKDSFCTAVLNFTAINIVRYCLLFSVWASLRFLKGAGFAILVQMILETPSLLLSLYLPEIPFFRRIFLRSLTPSILKLYAVVNPRLLLQYPQVRSRAVARRGPSLFETAKETLEELGCAASALASYTLAIRILTCYPSRLILLFAVDDVDFAKAAVALFLLQWIVLGASIIQISSHSSFQPRHCPVYIGQLLPICPYDTLHSYKYAAARHGKQPAPMTAKAALMASDAVGRPAASTTTIGARGSTAANRESHFSLVAAANRAKSLSTLTSRQPAASSYFEAQGNMLPRRSEAFLLSFSTPLIATSTDAPSAPAATATAAAGTRSGN
ncbi:hypothetical protein DFJ73DRAFT_792741, partial [Zopfochytrium polystomum]